MQERLQKIIARAGIASRRHAEQLILSGQVKVNGKIIRELGSKADTGADKIEVSGKKISAEERKIYLLLNKPPEIVSTLADPEGRKTLRNLLRGMPERVYPVGNLEYSASGVVFPRIQSGTIIQASSAPPITAPRSIRALICSSLNWRLCGASTRQFE